VARKEPKLHQVAEWRKNNLGWNKCDDPCCWSWALQLVPEPTNYIKLPNCLNTGNTYDQITIWAKGEGFWFWTLHWSLCCILLLFAFTFQTSTLHYTFNHATCYTTVHIDFADNYRNTFIFFNCFDFIILFLSYHL